MSSRSGKNPHESPAATALQLVPNCPDQTIGRLFLPLSEEDIVSSVDPPEGADSAGDPAEPLAGQVITLLQGDYRAVLARAVNPMSNPHDVLPGKQSLRTAGDETCATGLSRS